MKVVIAALTLLSLIASVANAVVIRANVANFKCQTLEIQGNAYISIMVKNKEVANVLCGYYEDSAADDMEAYCDSVAVAAEASNDKSLITKFILIDPNGKACDDTLLANETKKNQARN